MIRHTQDSGSASTQLRGRQLVASVVRATFKGLNICAGVDIAACAASTIGDLADVVTATGVLIDRNTVLSLSKNLKDTKGLLSVNNTKQNCQRICTWNEWRLPNWWQLLSQGTLSPSSPSQLEPLKPTMSALTPVRTMERAKRAAVKRMVCRFNGTVKCANGELETEFYLYLKRNYCCRMRSGLFLVGFAPLNS